MNYDELKADPFFHRLKDLPAYITKKRGVLFILEEAPHPDLSQKVQIADLKNKIAYLKNKTLARISKEEPTTLISGHAPFEKVIAHISKDETSRLLFEIELYDADAYEKLGQVRKQLNNYEKKAAEYLSHGNISKAKKQLLSWDHLMTPASHMRDKLIAKKLVEILKDNPKQIIYLKFGCNHNLSQFLPKELQKKVYRRKLIELRSIKPSTDTAGFLVTLLTVYLTRNYGLPLSEATTKLHELTNCVKEDPKALFEIENKLIKAKPAGMLDIGLELITSFKKKFRELYGTGAEDEVDNILRAKLDDLPKITRSLFDKKLKT